MALNQNSNIMNSSDLHLNHAMQLFKACRFQDTIKYIDSQASKTKHKDILFIRGSANYKLNNFKEAQQDWETASCEGSTNPHLYFSQAKLFLEQGNPKTATNKLIDSIKLGKDDSESWHMLALALIKCNSKDYYHAIKQYLVKSKYSKESYEKACKIYLTNCRFNELISFINENSLANEKNPIFYIYKAKAFIGISHYSEAQRILLSHKCNLDTFEGLFCMAICNLRSKQYSKCIESILNAKKLGHRSQTLSIILGQAYYYSGKCMEAFEVWSESFKKNQKKPHPELLFWLGKYFYENTNNLPEAINFFNLEIKASQHDREESYFFLVLCLINQSKLDKARQVHQIAASKFPHSILIESLNIYFFNTSDHIFNDK